MVVAVEVAGHDERGSLPTAATVAPGRYRRRCPAGCSASPAGTAPGSCGAPILSLLFTTARSSLPSPLKSSTASVDIVPCKSENRGAESVTMDVGGWKVPSPLFRKIFT